MIDKSVADTKTAIEGLKHGDTLMLSGFGGAGMANALIDAVIEAGLSDLTIVANGAGKAGSRVAQLFELGRVKKLICSAARAKEPQPKGFEARWNAGEIELEHVPQGTFTERMRAAGAGFPAYYTPVAVGTGLAEGKEVRNFDGKDFVMERALHGDMTFIRADKADRWGNLRFKGTDLNFASVMAVAAKITVVECNEYLGDNAIPPHDVHIPGIFVDRVIQAEDLR